MNKQRPLLDPHATEEEVVIDKVVNGELADVFAPIPEAAKRAMRARAERDRRIEEETLRIKQALLAEYKQVIALPSQLIADYDIAREKLLLRRWAEAGAGWCDQHRGIVSADELQLVFHEGNRLASEDKNYRVWTYIEPFQELLVMCADCRAKYGFGVRVETVKDSYPSRSVRISSYLSNCTLEENMIRVEFMRGYRVDSTLENGAWDRRKARVRRKGQRLLPGMTKDKRFKLKDGSFFSYQLEKICGEWLIPPPLKFQLPCPNGAPGYLSVINGDHYEKGIELLSSK